MCIVVPANPERLATGVSPLIESEQARTVTQQPARPFPLRGYAARRTGDGDPRIGHARLACWAVFVGLVSALNYLARFDGNGRTGARDAVYSWSTFAGGLALYLAWGALVVAISAGRWDLLLLRRPRSRRRSVGLMLASLAAIFLVEAAVALIPLPESPGAEQGLTPAQWQPAHAPAFAANLFLFVAVVPLVEEVTFRGLGQSLLSFLGRWPSLLLVGAAFGVAHGLVEGLLVLVPFGVILAWLRDRTESVLPGILVHGLFNGVALAAAILG